MVERALALTAKQSQTRIVDIGTGSGAIAVTLAAERPQAQVIAADISRPALTIAHLNAQRHLPNTIPFVQADLLQPFSTSFDLICANPALHPHP